MASSKLAKAVMTGPQQHTAGLFSDISVDGPEIGTLIVIMDRARNLPNRKTMGKQDAYCAARLGKEAKKTDTDRRGGQTPKWDQELRFVVHDALDYHQLKVSVFSEDKRTDLIGECWVPLDPILVPGGGKNDLWHTLNFKGRYAGEIRVELTFYDSRPREVKVEDAMGAREKESTKAVKRRPLPADPVHGNSSPVSWHGPRPLPGTTSQPSPAPSTSSQDVPRSRRETPNQQQPIQAAPPPSRTEPQYHSRSQSDFDMESHYDMSYSSQPDQIYNDRQSAPVEDHDDSAYNYNGSAVSAPAAFGEIELPELPPHTPRSHRNSKIVTPKYYSPANSSPAYTLPQYEVPSEVQMPTARERGNSYNAPGDDFQKARPMRTYSADDSLPQHQQLHQQLPEHIYRHNSEGGQQRYDNQDEIDISAPPPPRHSNSLSSSQGQSSYNAPAPLNIRRSGQMNATSPLFQEQNVRQDQYEDMQFGSRSSALSAPTTAHHTPTTQRYQQETERRGSVGNPHYDGHNTISASNRQSHSNRTFNQDASYDHDYDWQEEGYRQDPHIPRSIESNQPIRHGSNQSAELYLEHAPSQQRYAYREDGPVAKPQAVSPGAKTMMRKSVSPRPSVGPEEPSLRGVAFSPDSFDQFNPHMGSSNPGSQLGTPESSRVGKPGRDFASKIDTAPIIGSDGRVIDPSDHLPSDTWAPEPEKKSPRKSHQINVKFRHVPQTSPQRSQPTTPSRPLPQMATSPSSMMSSPMQQQTPQFYPSPKESPSYNGDMRHRLQKRPPSHIQSSPNNTPPQHHRLSANQPLRERPNNGYNNTSPGYQRYGPTDAPPVPAKIPHSAQQEDWHQQQQQPYIYAQQQYQQQPQQPQYQGQSMSLSEEMSRIDIGSGGNGRTRRSPVRYGA